MLVSIFLALALFTTFFKRRGDPMDLAATVNTTHLRILL